MRPEGNEQTIEKMSVIRHTLGIIKACGIETEVMFNLKGVEPYKRINKDIEKPFVRVMRRDMVEELKK